MSITIKSLMQQRRDTAANWTSDNPTLLNGELGYETDTGKWKVGTGSAVWAALAYTPWSQINAYPITTANIADDAVTGAKLANDITIANNLTVTNNLTVNGTTTTIDSTTLVVEDKNIEIGKVSTPSDTTADGGGITLKGASDKTLTWVNSTDCWTFNQGLNLTAGTAGAPALVFNGDVNSGLFQPGVDSLAIATAGAQRVTVDSSGRLLVGTTTEGEATADNLTIADSGHCGITLRSGTSSVGTIFFSDGTSGASEYQGYVQYDHSANYLKWATAGAERMRIDSSGRILIGPGAIATPKCGSAGIDVPNYDYSIVMGGSDGNGNRANTANKDGRFCGAHYTNAEEPIGIIRCSSGASASEIYMGGGSSLVNAATLIGFYTAANNTTTGGTERMRINSSGRLLVGATSALSNVKIDSNLGSPLFQVQGSTYQTGALSVTRTSNGSPYVYLNSGSSGNNATGSLARIMFNGFDGTNYVSAASLAADVDGTPGTNDMPGRLVFSTTADGASSPTERLRIDSNGKLVVGATSFLSGANSFTQAMISGSDGGLIINSTNTSASSYCRLMFTPNGHITGHEGLIRYNTSDYHMAFWTQGNERMRIDSSGHILVGTTTAGFAAYGDSLTIANSSHCGMTLRGGTTSDTELFFADGTTGTARYAGGIRYAHSTDHMQFTVNANERMRIDSSGRLLVSVVPLLQCLQAQTSAGYFLPTTPQVNTQTLLVNPMVLVELTTTLAASYF